MKDELAKVLLYYGLIYSADSPEQKIVCPFHEDVNPSMIVNLEKNSFFCFGCQESGDALRFVQLLEKKLHDLNELEACQKYYKILKSRKVRKLEIHYSKKEQKSKKQAYSEAYDYYHGLSKVKWSSKDLPQEMVDVREYMRGRGFEPKLLEAIDARYTYNYSYPIVFPMLDNGVFKGWVCRTDKPEIAAKRKYLYNEGFSRATSLIGQYNDCEILFVVEGYMDKLRFIQNGITNVVAILGWKASQTQIEKIKAQKNIKYVVSALDNDKYGKKGSAYLKQMFPDKYMRFCYLANLKDTGEANKKQFEKMLNKTLDKIKALEKNKKEGSSKNGYLR